MHLCGIPGYLRQPPWVLLRPFRGGGIGIEDLAVRIHTGHRDLQMVQDALKERLFFRT